MVSVVGRSIGNASLTFIFGGRRLLQSDFAQHVGSSRAVVGPGIRNVGFIHYWDSFEALQEYARDSDLLHFPAWQDYYEDGTKEDAAVGIWHETFIVDPD
ncbi:hypothetical protein BRD19_08890, partial [Halobacteriales archaeon SW_7_65_23]